MNEVQSVVLGLAIGLVMISVLSFFPGEPFDYYPKSKGNSKKQEKEEDDESGRKPASPSPSPCSLPEYAHGEASKVSECSPVAPSGSSPAAVPRTLHQRAAPIPTATEQKQTEKMCQMLKIRKLQTLLGIEKHKMDELIARANADAVTAQDDEDMSSFSPSTKSYGAYLDVFFYTTTLGLLAYVLKSEYGVDLWHIVAHMFPREVETATQVLHGPAQFLQQLTTTIQNWAH